MAEPTVVIATIIRHLEGHNPRVHRTIAVRVTDEIPDDQCPEDPIFDDKNLSPELLRIHRHLKFVAEVEINNLKKDFPEFENAYFGVTVGCF